MTSLLLSSQKTFRIFIIISFVAHICIFLFLLFAPQVFRPKSIEIKEAIRVDMVGLPDIKRPQAPARQKPQKETKKSAPKKPKPKPPKPKKPEPKKPKVKKELKKVEKTKAKPNPQQTKTAQSQAIENLREEKPRYAGEQISKGESQEGEVSALLISAYSARIRAHLNRNWNIPQFLADKNLRATMVIYINKLGQVTRIELEKTSGDESFDQIVIETIRISSPLPEPPQELIYSLSREGIGFNFP